MATALADIAALTEIELTVLDNMRLALYPQEVARAGEHNSATFRIVQQPASLASLPCRAEIKTADGSTFYVLVAGGTFALTNDITKHGVGTLQLVYGDDAVSHRTQIAQYWVAPSLFALDPSDPEYKDGLAQLTLAAFTDAETAGTLLIFKNFAGQVVKAVTFPGSGLDEAQANLLYLRLDGGTLRGPVLAPGQTTPAQQQLISREYADSRFISIDGGSIVGPISAIYDATSPAPTNLVTRQFVEAQGDARYLQLSGGQLSGVLSMAVNQRIISAMGAGNAPMLCIGTNDSGFWRTGQSLILEMGYAVTAIFSPSGSTFYGPILLPGPPTQPTQAATKGYADNLRAPSVKFDIPVNFPLTAAWQNLYSVPYQIPRGGLSRVRVSLSASCSAAQQGGLGVVGISCQPEIAIDRIERQVFVYNLNGTSTGLTAEFFVDVNGAAPVLTIQATALATNPPSNDITILGGDTFNIQRSQILIEDLGAR